MAKRYGNWIAKSRRLAIHLRDNFTCLYCGRNLLGCQPHELTLDHVDTWIDAVKPDHSNGNLITACNVCNSARGRRPWRDYAPGYAQERIVRQLAAPVNAVLARAILQGKTGDPRLEGPRG